MTVYEKLKRKEEILIGASLRAESQDMKELWLEKSKELQKKIGEMTVEEAEQARKEADEKLTIAVKALKNIIDGNDLACERGESMASWMDSDFRRQAKDALKEIQG